MAGGVVIAGGGIGGLTAALCLARAGQAVTLVERRETVSEAGAGIQLSPNASRVLCDLGLADALGRLASEPVRLSVRDARDGHVLGTMALDGLAREHGAPYWCLRRADLHATLREAALASPGITLRQGETIRDFILDEDGRHEVVVARADESRSTLPADLLVGADGLWSVTRRVLHPRRLPDPRFTGYAAWRTLLPADAASQKDVGLWLGPGWHAVTYPVMGGAFLNLVLVRESRDDSPGWGRPGNAAELAPLAAGATPALAGLLRAAPQWQVWSLFDAAVPVMAGSRIALVGDAAHPILPFLAQGAALAIEDAATLAASLAGVNPGDAARLGPALAAYDRLRRPRASRVQRAARLNGRTYHLPWPATLARNAVMGTMGPAGMARHYAWLYGWRLQPR